MATTEERLAQLERQQQYQTQALAALLGDHYDDGAESAKSMLVALNEPKYKGLAVVEKENAPKGDGGGGGGDYPVTQVPSPNHYTGDLHAGGVWAICVHTMAGTLASCDGWFGNPASQVSSHYGAGLAGELHQYVALANGSWANGVLEGGNVWVPYFDSSDNPNHHAVTIETEDNGSGETAVSDAQYAAVLAACRLALEQWPAITTLTVHRAISPQSRPACAGDRWWDSGRVQDLATDLGLDLLV
jgi:hypothetical protein